MSDDHKWSADAEPLPEVGHPCTLLLRLQGYGIGSITLVQGRGDHITFYETHNLKGVLKRLPKWGEGADWFLTLNTFKDLAAKGPCKACAVTSSTLTITKFLHGSATT